MKKLSLSPSLRLMCGALLIGASAACSGVPPAPPATAPAASGDLSTQITQAIGDAACDNASQCRTLAVGHKACGGPEGYLAWSSKRSDGARLASLAARQAAERKAADARDGMMSTCSVVIDPGATCKAGRCTLLPPRSNTVELK